MSAWYEALSPTLIVGGGVVGLSLAWELACRGKKVCVIDANEIGRGASWAGAGILPPSALHGAMDPYEQLKSLSHQLHPEWAQRLRHVTGIDNGFQRCGGVYLARSRGEAATLNANRLWWEEHGIEHEKWGETELLRFEPNLKEFVGRKLQSAWHLPDECQLRNPRHLKALMAACRAAGVELLEHCPMRSPLISGGRVVGVQAAERIFQVEQVCIASGAWARNALQSLGIETGIMPVRGQMVLYQCPEPLLGRVVNEGNRYLVPRSDGKLLAGSVEEEVGYVVETTVEAISQIRDWAEGILPKLRTCPVEKTWAGLRPGSYDGFPYLGQVPGVANLFVAAGHYRSGLHLSCATATVMADLMLGQPAAIDLRPFRVGR